MPCGSSHISEDKGCVPHAKSSYNIKRVNQYYTASVNLYPIPVHSTNSQQINLTVMYLALMASLTLLLSLSPAVIAEGLKLCETPRPGPRTVSKCGGVCAFRLCNTNGTIFRLDRASYTLLGAPRTATTPFICKSGGDVFNVESGQARVFIGNRSVPISEWNPPSLSPPFPRDIIKAYKMAFLDFFGIGRLPTNGNQWRFLHNRCMVLPIRSYRTKPGPEGKTIDVAGDPTACVAFRTTAPKLHAELIWDTMDDFDLGLVEPGGYIIDTYCPRSSTGKLNGDNNQGFCNTRITGGKENIVYFPKAPINSGRYEVFAKHTRSCKKDFTRVVLRVMKNGVVMLQKKRESMRDPRATRVQEIFTENFRV